MTTIKPVDFAKPDNPAHFSYALDTLGSPYCGDVGMVWVPLHCSREDPVSPLSTLVENKEWAGNYCFACVSPFQGPLVAPIVADIEGLTTDDPAPSHLHYLQLGKQTVRDDKEFERGNLARFYPPETELYYLNGFEEAGGPQAGAAGKPFFCRQRGAKLWMMTWSGRAELVPQDDLQHFDVGQLWAHPDSRRGETVLVGNIWEPEDADTVTTETRYENYDTITDFTGKQFEAMYEHRLIGTIDFAWHSGGIGSFPRFPVVVAYCYGVGNDSLFFIDAKMHSEFQVLAGGEFSFNARGTVWSRKWLDAVEVVPYKSNRIGLSHAPNVQRSDPHFMEGRVHTGSMYYPGLNSYPSTASGPPDDAASNPTLADKQQHYPTHPAPRDTPWMVGSTVDQYSLGIGRFTWLEDELPLEPELGTPVTSEFRIDNRPAHGFSVIAVDDAPQLLPDYVDEFENPVQGFIGTAAYELHHLILRTTPTGAVFGVKNDRWGGYAIQSTMECRAYDRLVEDECRGAIDLVLYHKGMLLKNDVFHSEEPKRDYVSDGDYFSDTHNYDMFDDYHCSVRNKIVDFSSGQGVLSGYGPIMAQPYEAKVFIRRWKKGIDHAAVADKDDPAVYTPYRNANGDLNDDPDWTEEYHDLMTRARKRNPAWDESDGNEWDDAGEPKYIEMPTRPDPDNPNGPEIENTYYGWVPISACLTPYGDFIVTSIQPYHDGEHPFDGFLPGTADSHIPSDSHVDRTPRYFMVERPGHWRFKTRLPVLNTEFVSGMNRWPDESHIPDPNDRNWNFKLGDWADTIGGPMGNAAINEAYNWSRCRNPVGMSCNEHTLTLTNFPAAMFGNKLTEKDIYGEIIDGERVGGFSDPDMPTNEELLGHEPIQFTTERLPYRMISQRNARDNVPGSPQFEQSATLGTQKAWLCSVAHEWNIDMATGKIRVPWRRITLHWENNSNHLDVKTDVHRRMEPGDFTDQTDGPSGEIITWEIALFQPEQCEEGWTTKSFDSTVSGSPEDLLQQAWAERYNVSTHAGLAQSDLGIHWNTTAQFAICQFADGITPAMTSY